MIPGDIDAQKTEYNRRLLDNATLWVTDAELIRRMGCPEKVARQAIRALDGNPRSGFPRKQALWANRRYWPAVKLWLDRNNGVISTGVDKPVYRPY